MRRAIGTSCMRVYFADYIASNNELIEILREIDEKNAWKARSQTLDELFEHGAQQWAVDTANEVEDHLNSFAYQMLCTCALFDESTRYGADFGGNLEEWFGRTREEFKALLRKAVT